MGHIRWIVLGLHLLNAWTVSCKEDIPESYIEKQRYDGWYNNLAHPSWGSVESRLTRKTPASYADGVYMLAGQDRPSPRTLSQALLNGRDGMASERNRTAMLAFFGQVVSSEILQASEAGCPIEMHKIDIDKCDEMFDRFCTGPKFMPFHRAGYDYATGQSPNSPREQLNYVTSWLDGNFVYSTSEARLNMLRSFSNGTFRTDPEDPSLPPRNVERIPMENNPTPHVLKILSPERMFLLGDQRTNQNPALLAFGILFFRWHNEQARRIQEEHPDWQDEEVFQKARRIVVAHLQNIIMYEFVPAFIDEEIPPYDRYRPDVHPGISHVFQSAAFRFGHTLVPPGLYRRDAGTHCPFIRSQTGYSALRLCSTWWDADDVMANSTVEQLLRGLASQLAEKEDHVLCSDVRNKLFGPLEFSRRDLGALNIMRGRDNGLPDYNTVRKCFHLDVVERWEDINPDLYADHPDLLESLRTLYKGDLMNVDLYVGGMLESQDGPGELFKAIIKEQFLRLRDADRFWFENEENGLFDADEIAAIRNVRLWDIIVNASGVAPEEVQRSVFFHLDDDPCPQPAQLNTSEMEPCVYMQGYDYFQGSEVTYIYSCILLAAVPLICAGAGYATVKFQNSRRRHFRTLQEENNNGRSVDKMMVKEWLHQNHKRIVKVKFGPNQEICTVNRKGEKLRRVNVAHVDTLVVEITQDQRRKPMVLLRPPLDHDLVLEFDTEAARNKFLNKLEQFLISLKKGLDRVQTNKEQMLANAETKERRTKRLEHFFREAYELTFGLKPGEKRKLEDAASDVVMVMRTSLSKKEFAGALGMKPDDIFVRRMFNIVDKDGDGRISFQEFLDTVVLFSKGSTDDKLRIIFDMCDNDRNGVIDKTELSEMLRSLVEIAKTNTVSDEEVEELINGMFSSSGINHKESLTYDDFKLMMREYKGDFIAIGLDCKGAKQNFLDTSTNVASKRMASFHISEVMNRNQHWMMKKYNSLATFLEENRQNVFYLFVFYVITIALFCERFIHYSFMAEHTDLRHIMGVGIAITRGAAASLSFCYSLLLLTMSRNLITKLKDFSFQQYIPLDSHIQFHKIVACTALFFSILHSCGHLVNFYHVSTQPVENLRCLTQEISFASDQKPTVGYWLFQTITGLTGVALFIIMCIIFIFAHPIIRRKAYKFFWAAHQLYILLYILSLLHGLARLTGAPRFWIFFVGPGIIYTLDKIISLRTRYMELDIIETELLPSDVVKVKFYRPPNFKYLSGQWVRLNCTAFRQSEYHSFTLTSAPHENFLSCHIKAQGPWTWKLRKFFDPHNYVHDEENPPKIRLEGPFGGGNQDWYKFEVAVMVGGGIGVTPYASILNDLVFGTSTNRYSGVSCKKVYFLWICPTHRQFEWFIDVLRDVERKDVTNVLEMHIFITQFFHKFDLRTTMLYICENHFQRLSKRSMFTGLKAINHFGRPDMTSFLKFVQKTHNYVSKIGVFSCGPNPLTKSVSTACENVNRGRRLPYFIHHFENFG
ncbi:dual oxidase-like [Penaeus monodon]|uniref:dual oxidase-like n=1 Tax=Penaeus monodon TaxID=6687 RepID=UPI0018A6FB6A|nr:dual oxidase-like [Penaeus monodon]